MFSDHLMNHILPSISRRCRCRMGRAKRNPSSGGGGCDGFRLSPLPILRGLIGIIYEKGTTSLGNLTYTYDAAGNRVAQGGSLAETGLPNAVISVSYDADGNLVSDGVNTYTWNARDELVAISGAVTVSFAYDALGRRISKSIAGVETEYLYNGLNMVQELSNGSPTADLLTRLGIDEIFSRTDANGARHFLTDALGSIVGLTGNSGTPTTRISTSPLGRLR
jgi:YD repeat-containing protein